MGPNRLWYFRAGAVRNIAVLLLNLRHSLGDPGGAGAPARVPKQ